MDSKLLYGTDTLAEIMKKETMEQAPFVSVNQKYSANDNPKMGIHKNDELYPNGKHRFDQNKDHDKHDSRAPHAVGGVAKHRLGYPNTDGAIGSDRGD